MSAACAMPGSFTPDPDTTRLEFPTARRPSFYIPPSPSATSILSPTARSSSQTSSSAAATDSRKRSRDGVRGRDNAADTPRASRGSLPSRSSYALDAPSPAPLVNTEYVFAGGAPAADRYGIEEDSMFEFEKDLRPGRFARTHSGRSESYFPRTPGADGGGKRRRLSSPRGGWGRTMWQYTGGMAGKAINFCWTVAFNGFHAGEGRGYAMDVGTPVVMPGDPTDLSSSRDVFDDNYQGGCGTPVPGSFPCETDSEGVTKPAYDPVPTPTTSNDWGGTSTLKSNWVMVDAPNMCDPETSPARKRPRPSTASLYGRSSSRPSGPRPRMHTRNSASFASPRASLLVGRAALPQQRPHSSGSDRPQHKRTRSSVAAAAASPRRRESGTETTPKSPDVVKFEKKMHKQSQRQDDSMRRMNQQMQDMIKEAQQALGAKVDVVDDTDEDEGFAEGTPASSYGGGGGW